MTGHPGTTMVVHTRRGNEGVAGLGSGGYHAVAERVFGRLKVDGYLLEYDTPRAGDFAPLRFLPKEAIAVLGLVSTKVLELESNDTLKRRVNEAAQVIDLDRLGSLSAVRLRFVLPLRPHGARPAGEKAGAAGRHGL